MNELLKVILSLSCAGTLLMIILLLLKPLYKNRLSKGWQYYIWLVVVIRMLLPFAPGTTLVGSAFEYWGNMSSGTIQAALPANASQPDIDSENNNIAPNAEPQASNKVPAATPPRTIQSVLLGVYQNLWIVWAALAFALLLRKVTIYQSFVRFVSAGQTEVSDIEILNMLADAEEVIGVKRPVELFTNPLISSPMLLGFFRPYIILPSIQQDRTELAHILRHELTHYKRLDMFYKWLVQITVCVHWFNPFAYLLAKEINKGCELSCDEAMVKTMNMDEKKTYGDTLLNSLRTKGIYNDKLATVTLTEGAVQLKERLDAIMKFKKKSRTVAALTLVLTVMLCIGTVAVGAYTIPSSTRGNAAGTPPASNPASVYLLPSASGSEILPDNIKELAVSFVINNGGVELLSASSNEIKASYDSEYYDVHITNKNGRYFVSITGKVSMMGKTDDVQLYMPNVKRRMDVNVENGNFSYALPESCVDEINITAHNAGIDFSSKNGYHNSAILLMATNQDFIKYQPPVFPSYFTKTNTGFEYTNGTGENKINITLTGYTSVNFAENPSAVNAQDVAS